MRTFLDAMNAVSSNDRKVSPIETTEIENKISKPSSELHLNAPTVQYKSAEH